MNDPTQRAANRETRLGRVSSATRAGLDVLRGVFRDPRLEQQYQKTEYAQTLWLYRFAVFASGMIHASYLFIDHFVLGEQAPTMWLLRLTLLIPASLLLWAVSYRPWFERYALALTISLFIVNGTAMAFGTALFGAQSTMYFAPGTVMVIIYAYILLSIHYWIATVLSLTLVTLHVLVLMAMNVPSGPFANAVEVLLVSTFILLVGGHRVAMSSRTAFLASDLLARNEGAKAERTRIMRDLHDDVAARLLTLMHRAPEPDQQQQARDALSALREVIYALDDNQPVRLGDLLSETEAQVRERLRGTATALQWEDPAQVPDITLTPRERINLSRVVQEAVSNALRHARPTHLIFRCQCSRSGLAMQILNDGALLQPEEWKAGKGLHNIRTRMAEIGGTAHWSVTRDEMDTLPRCCLTLALPLPEPMPA